MHLTIHVSCMIGMMAWKNARKSSVLFLFFVLLSFYVASLFFLLCALAYRKGFLCFLLVTCAFCCIFHCFENLPLTKLSHPIIGCASMSRLYLSYPACPRILIIAFVTDSPLKYGSKPSCSMLHSRHHVVLMVKNNSISMYLMRIF